MGDVVITSFSLGLLNNLERPKKCTYVVCTQMQVRLIQLAKGKFNNGEIVKANLALFEQRLNLDFLELSKIHLASISMKANSCGSVWDASSFFVFLCVGTFFTLLVSESLLNADYCSLAGIRRRVSVSFCFCPDCSLTCID